MNIAILLIIFLISLSSYKPFRYYIFSFFFFELYNHPNVAKILGFDFQNGKEWKTTRYETRLYVGGFFSWLFSIFTGMDLRVNDEIREQISKMTKKSKELDMQLYFNDIMDKDMSLKDFENFLSMSIIRETNRVYEILDSDKEKILMDNISVILDVVNGMSGNLLMGYYKMIVNIFAVIKVSRVLRSIPKAERLFIFGPQLSLVDNTSKMLVREKNNLRHIQPYEFLNITTKFFVFEYIKGGLVFVSHENEKNNTAYNRSFGPRKDSSGPAFICPGNIFTMNFIKSILSFFDKFNISVIGEPKYTGTRFIKISNKAEIRIKFSKNNLEPRTFDEPIKDNDETQYDNDPILIE